ncbi:ABC transporter permease [Methylobacterium terricola]|uniref:ABC transporter permease n=1 Tax=Methylobacterium terricola TaxID=2583531 RepID=A0A5C4LLD8_9HYPH|nr:ABC transporter permease [Methylobacterium terricola]TNC14088.1 ABC transporter permease [Methylobacterium terricola]
MSRRMVKLIAGRVLVALATLLFVSAVVFGATQLLPGDVAQAILGQSATPEAVAGLRHALGLDVPALQRFVSWLGGLLTGDAGLSLVNRQPVGDLIWARLSNSLILAGIVAAISVPLALTLGITAAVWRGSLYDRAVGVVTISAVSIPEFLVATLAVLIFAVHLQWLPALSFMPRSATPLQFLRAVAMPVMTLSFVVITQMVRMTRAAVIEALKSPYVEMAALKGASPARVVLRHVLPNTVGAIANAVALSLSYLLGGVIIVETIFNYPGIAKLMVDSVSMRDMPVVQACAIVFCAVYLLLVTTADIVAILSNPRLRHS